jgi:hypothetical protein
MCCNESRLFLKGPLEKPEGMETQYVDIDFV